MHSPPASRHLTHARFIAGFLLALILSGPAALRAEPDSFKVNDRIESNLSVFGWQKGTVKEIGTGDRAGQLRILIDGNANDAWVSAPALKFVRKLAGSAPAPPAENNQPPRLGKYLIMSYGAGPNPLHLGYFRVAQRRELSIDGHG